VSGGDPGEGRLGRLLLDHALGAEISSVDWLPGAEGVVVGLSAWGVPTLRAVGLSGDVRWTWSGHRVGVVACSPAAELVAAGRDTGIVALHDPATGVVVAELPRVHAGVRQLAWSPSGDLLVSASDHDAAIWDVATRTLRCTAVVAGYDAALAVDPTGSQLAWAAARGSGLHRLDTGAAMVLVPEGGMAVTWADGEPVAVAWRPDAATISRVRDGVRIGAVAAGDRVVSATAWSPDARVLAMASGGIRLHRSRSREPAVELAGHGRVTGLAFAPDGSRLAALIRDGLDLRGVLRVWDVAGVAAADPALGVPAHPLTPPTGPLGGVVPGGPEFQRLAVSPFGRHLCHVDGHRAARVTDLVTGHVVRSEQFADRPVAAIAASPDGRRLACLSERGDLTVVEPLSFRGLTYPATLRTAAAGIPRQTRACAWSPDSRAVVCTGVEPGAVTLRDADSGEIVRTFRRREGAVWTDLACSADGLVAASARAPGRLPWAVVAAGAVWRLDTGEYVGEAGAITVSLAPGGVLVTDRGSAAALVASAVRFRADGDLRRWASPQPAWSRPVAGLVRARIDTAGRRVAVAAGSSVVVVDAGDGREVADIDAGGEVVDVAWFPDGAQVAIAVARLGVRLWQVPS
jgi:WD40 repeat protein